MSLPKKIIEGVLELEGTEDGGQARICCIQSGDGQTFVRFQSWEEEDQSIEMEPEDFKHSILRQFENKKVRITIEVLE